MATLPFSEVPSGSFNRHVRVLMVSESKCPTMRSTFEGGGRALRVTAIAESYHDM